MSTHSSSKRTDMLSSCVATAAIVTYDSVNGVGVGGIRRCRGAGGREVGIGNDDGYGKVDVAVKEGNQRMARGGRIVGSEAGGGFRVSWSLNEFKEWFDHNPPLRFPELALFSYFQPPILGRNFHAISRMKGVEGPTRPCSRSLLQQSSTS